MIYTLLLLAGIVSASALLAWIAVCLIPAFVNPNGQPQASISWKICYWTHEYLLGGYKHGSIYDTDEENWQQDHESLQRILFMHGHEDKMPDITYFQHRERMGGPTAEETLQAERSGKKGYATKRRRLRLDRENAKVGA